jgi:hypothetical protein
VHTHSGAMSFSPTLMPGSWISQHVKETEKALGMLDSEPPEVESEPPCARQRILSAQPAPSEADVAPIHSLSEGRDMVMHVDALQEQGHEATGHRRPDLRMHRPRKPRSEARQQRSGYQGTSGARLWLAVHASGATFGVGVRLLRLAPECGRCSGPWAQEA